MIILKTIVFIWAVCSIFTSVWWFILYADNREKGLGKIDLLVSHLIAPYIAVNICVLCFEEVIIMIKKIIKKRRLKRNGNNA